MTDMLAYVTDKDATYTYADVKPARYASRPPRYLQALGELDDAWDNFNRFATLLEEGKPVEGDFEAATRAVVDAQKKVSRIYYELNLAPLEVMPEVEIARSDALDATPFWAGKE